MRLALSLLLIALNPDYSQAREPYDAGDWTLSILSANVGMGLGGVAGFGLTAALFSEDCDGESWGCGLDNAAQAILGGSIIGTMGGAAGAWGYGELKGRDGSFGGALLGSLLGTGAGLLTAGLMCGSTQDFEYCVGGGILGLGLAGAGATLGYLWGEPDEGPPPSGALLDLRQGQFALSVPAIDIARVEGGYGIYLPVLGGRL